MSDPRHDRPPPAAQAPPAARNVPALLLTLRREGFTGSVTVSGAPGGTIHLEHGLVTAIETPGAPTAETLLLKSRRVAEADWTVAEASASAARAGGAAPNRGSDLGAVLVAQGSVGAAELEAVCAAAAFDGAFTLALSPPGTWQAVAAAPPAGIALRPGIEPQRIFEETARRTALLTDLWGSPAELTRARIRASAQSASAASRIPVRYREILAAANGRHTARDIGFALGRGVFAVLLDLVRMDTRHLIHWESPHQSAMAPSVAPRRPTSGLLPAATEVGPLPRRVPAGRDAGSSGGPTGPAGPAAPAERAAAPSYGPPNAHRVNRTESTETTEKST
ncbi:hypothetical protein [Kitasatospora sp. NPDC057223]|uniref:hypothetical protein n=1 Tax=Kitasatospora sp. NPDC057223 TaxID=3346055 RepID=UPI0036414038